MEGLALRRILELPLTADYQDAVVHRHVHVVGGEAGQGEELSAIGDAGAGEALQDAPQTVVVKARRERGGYSFRIQSGHEQPP